MISIDALRAAGLALLFGAVALPSAAAQAVPPLQREAEALVETVGGDWGVFAWSIDRQAPLISIRADDVFVPASNNKVLTSIWALDVLGPDHRFHTDLLVTGPVEGGVLRGDVVIRGSGDPAFGYPAYEPDPMDPLRVMAKRLWERGVRVVEGAVVGDGTVFDSVLVGPSWPRDTGGGSAHYAPGVSGLPFRRNMLEIEVRANPAGGAPLVTAHPAAAGVPVASTVRAGGGRVLAVRNPGNDTIQVRGAVAGNRPYLLKVGVSDPARLTAGALADALQEVGIEVRGGVRTGATPSGAKTVHRHVSIPVGAMMAQLNQESDNFFAEHLWKAAAARVVGEGSFDRGGAASALHFMREAGVPAGQIYQFDGSGLSSYNRTSPRALVRALEYAHARQYSDLFHRSMAVAGSREGTLRRMFVGTEAQDNLHAKTGYIAGVRTLSGYVRARNGELIAFSFLYNGRGTSPARGVQTTLGALLAGYGAPPETTLAAGPE